MASLIHDINNNGDPNREPLFNGDDFLEVEKTVTADPKENLVYAVYATIYSSILERFNYSYALYQKFENGFYRVSSKLIQMQNAEDALALDDDFPLVMTQSQYDRLEAIAANKKKNTQENYYTLIFYVLGQFLAHPEKAPQTVRDAIEAAKLIPGKGKPFSEYYNELKPYGYFTLPDGRRSDHMTPEEWAESSAPHPRDYNKDLLEDELLFKGARAIKAFVKKQTGQTLEGTPKQIEQVFKNFIIDINESATDETEQRIIALINDALNNVFPPDLSFHLYEELPEDLTAYDLITLLSRCCDDKGTERLCITALKDEFSDLFTALDSYLDSKLTKIRALRLRETFLQVDHPDFDPFKDFISWEELAEAGIIGYAEKLRIDARDVIEVWTDGDNSFRGLSRLVRSRHGVAIIKDPVPYEIAKNGDFIEGNGIARFTKETLNDVSYFMEYPEEMEKIKGCFTELVYPTLTFLQAYNTLVEILAKVYDLPEIKDALKVDESLFTIKLETYNKLIYVLYRNVYGTDAMEKAKRAFIRKNFPEIDPDDFKPSKEAIKQVTEQLTNLEFSENAKLYLHCLDLFMKPLMASAKGAR